MVLSIKLGIIMVVKIKFELYILNTTQKRWTEVVLWIEVVLSIKCFYFIF